MSQILAAEIVAESPPGSEEPEGKKLSGRSPTQIAFERLRKDKMAVICSVIVLLLVLAAIFAPLICKILNIYPTTASAPYQASDVLAFDTGLPKHGPPNGGFWPAHPLGL